MIAGTRAAARTPIVTGALPARMATVVASSIGFLLPFAVVPEYAERSAGATVAGAANAALPVTTVAVELAAPALVGLVSGVSALLALPAGTWLAQVAGRDVLVLVLVLVRRGPDGWPAGATAPW
ncbi:hypothetical protein ACWEPL_26135 [Nonomuraea sp. NPDC004186]